jgi:hypothetical protein
MNAHEDAHEFTPGLGYDSLVHEFTRMILIVTSSSAFMTSMMLWFKSMISH